MLIQSNLDKRTSSQPSQQAPTAPLMVWRAAPSSTFLPREPNQHGLCRWRSTVEYFSALWPAQSSWILPQLRTICFNVLWFSRWVALRTFKHVSKYGANANQTFKCSQAKETGNLGVSDHRDHPGVISGVFWKSTKAGSSPLNLKRPSSRSGAWMHLDYSQDMCTLEFTWASCFCEDNSSTDPGSVPYLKPPESPVHLNSPEFTWLTDPGSVLYLKPPDSSVHLNSPGFTWSTDPGSVPYLKPEFSQIMSVSWWADLRFAQHFLISAYCPLQGELGFLGYDGIPGVIGYPGNEGNQGSPGEKVTPSEVKQQMRQQMWFLWVPSLFRFYWICFSSDVLTYFVNQSADQLFVVLFTEI